MEDVKHICVVCGHEHNEDLEGRWDELSEDFVCPECGCGKDEYYSL